MKTLFVAGNFDMTGGRPSGLAAKMASYMENVTLYNGGHYSELQGLLDSVSKYKYVFWFANVPNDLPKVRDAKEVAPHIMLITSKRNDGGKYPFKELVMRAIYSKSNLVFEFSKAGDVFNIRILDPLGCVWYNGTDIESAVNAAFLRLDKLNSITRRGTETENKNLPLAWYFNSFASKMEQGAEKDKAEPVEKDFLNAVTRYSERFYEIMDVPKVDNVPMLPPQAYRCAKGMPSFKKDGRVYVSARVIPTQHIAEEDFMEVYEENGHIYYVGDRKPSVDTPIHLELYKALPKINYILHSHNYIKGAVMTKDSLPCGAVEEASAIFDVIEDKNKTFYAINELSHGSILMAADVNDLKAEYYARQMPEDMRKETSL